MSCRKDRSQLVKLKEVTRWQLSPLWRREEEVTLVPWKRGVSPLQRQLQLTEEEQQKRGRSHTSNCELSNK